MSIWSIVVAAGRGTRFGSAKQFEPFGRGTVLDAALEPARAIANGVVVALPSGVDEATWRPPPGVCTVVGGASRSASVRRALARVPGSATIIVVHDAARPLASLDLFVAVVDAVRAGADAAVPAVPIADTVKRVRGALVAETLPRDDLVAVQTPQAFRASVLRAAHVARADATDDAALVELAGGRVVVVPGEPGNMKLTDRTDLERLRGQRTDP